MNNIEPTGTPLTRKAVLEIVKDQILDSDCAKEKWSNFEAFVSPRWSKGGAIGFESDNCAFRDFLHDNPWAKEWLIKHGFATEVDDFVPFSIEVKTKEDFIDLLAYTSKLCGKLGDIYFQLNAQKNKQS